MTFVRKLRHAFLVGAPLAVLGGCAYPPYASYSAGYSVGGPYGPPGAVIASPGYGYGGYGGYGGYAPGPVALAPGGYYGGYYGGGYVSHPWGWGYQHYSGRSAIDLANEQRNLQIARSPTLYSRAQQWNLNAATGQAYANQHRH